MSFLPKSCRPSVRNNYGPIQYSSKWWSTQLLWVKRSLLFLTPVGATQPYGREARIFKQCLLPFVGPVHVLLSNDLDCFVNRDQLGRVNGPEGLWSDSDLL